MQPQFSKKKTTLVILHKGEVNWCDDLAEMTINPKNIFINAQ